MTAHQSIPKPDITVPLWYLEPEAVAILRDIQATPPRQRQYLAPIANIFAGRPEMEMGYDRNDPRVEELKFLCEAAFKQVEAEHGRAGALAFVYTLPSLDRVIDAALSEAARNPQPSKEGVA